MEHNKDDKDEDRVEEIPDYTEHDQAEVGVLNRLWYKEAVFYEVC